MYLFSKYLLGTYLMLSPVLGNRDTSQNLEVLVPVAFTS